MTRHWRRFRRTGATPWMLVHRSQCLSSLSAQNESPASSQTRSPAATARCAPPSGSSCAPGSPPRLSALHRDTFVIDDPLETTVELAAHRAESDLADLDLGDDPDLAAA